MIYKRLRDLREDKDMTQEDVAKILNVSQRAYSHYERGERAIPIEAWKKLSELHEKSIEYLSEISDEDEKTE